MGFDRSNDFWESSPRRIDVLAKQDYRNGSIGWRGKIKRDYNGGHRMSVANKRDRRLPRFLGMYVDVNILLVLTVAIVEGHKPHTA